MENYKAGGEKGNSNLFATNRLFKKSPLFRKRKKKAPGVYDPKAKYRFDKGGALLTKKVTCKKCGWEWDAADGGNDITTCHKCGGKGLIHAQKGGGLNEFAGGGPIDCGEGYEWNEELQQCVEYTSKYNQQSLAKHLAEKKIYEDALKEIEAGTAEYAILEEAYNTKVKKLEKEKARVLKVRGNVIPASQNLDLADNKINPRDPLYQNFLNASNPKELELARKALPQEIKNVLPNQGSYNVAKWNSKTNKWKDGSYPGRELYCTPYGCFAYQKAGASDVPIIGGNIDFANRAATGNFAFEKINPNERQLGDMALMVENAPNDYTDRNSGRSRRPHHTTIYAGPDTNAPKDSEKGYFYNADDGIRLNFKKSYLATDETPGDRFDYYRYVGAQNKINDEILDLAKQKEEFNIKQEQRKNNVALPSMATLEPKLITQNNTATLQYPKKEEILKPKNKKLFKKKSFKYGGLNKYEEEEGMILDLSPEEIKQYTEGGYVIEDISVPSLNHMDEGGALNEFAGGGASSCPKDHVWDTNTKKCGKVYTLANNKKLIDGVSNWAMQSSNPDQISSEYNDQIKHYLYSGKYGYDPVSGTLYPLKKEQKTVTDAETKKILAKQEDKAAHTQSIIDAGFDPDTFGKSKGTNVITGEEIYGDKSQEDVDKVNKEALNNFVTEGHRQAILESPFNIAASFTPAGMAAGVIQGGAALLPDAYNFAKDPSWSGAGAIGGDLLMMAPGVKSFGSPLINAIDNAVYPTRTYRASLPGGNEALYEASDLSKKVFNKGDFTTKNLDEARQYLAGSEATGRQGLLTGQDMNLTEYKVPFWKKNVSFDPDVVTLKNSQGVDINTGEYIIPKNKFLYPRKTTQIKAVPEELKVFNPEQLSSGDLPYYPSSMPVGPSSCLLYTSPSPRDRS